MRIVVETGDNVTITADHYGERVVAHGASLTEAVENLVIRFKQLQDAALEELQYRGFIRVEREKPEMPS